MTESAQQIWFTALVAGVVSLLVYLITNGFLPRLRRYNLTRALSIGRDQPHMGNARFRIVNNGHWTIHDAILYLQLDFTEADTMDPPPSVDVHIAPGRFVPLSQEQLCWSVYPNPMKAPICSREEQPFSPCKILPDSILIPTEEGWPGGARSPPTLASFRFALIQTHLTNPAQ
jgi:hypothetical protein